MESGRVHDFPLFVFDVFPNTAPQDRLRPGRRAAGGCIWNFLWCAAGVLRKAGLSQQIVSGEGDGGSGEGPQGAGRIPSIDEKNPNFAIILTLMPIVNQKIQQ